MAKKKEKKAEKKEEKLTYTEMRIKQAAENRKKK